MAKTKVEDNYIMRAVIGALLAGTGVFLVHQGMSLMQFTSSKKGNCD